MFYLHIFNLSSSHWCCIHQPTASVCRPCRSLDRDHCVEDPIRHPARHRCRRLICIGVARSVSGLRHPDSVTEDFLWSVLSVVMVNRTETAVFCYFRASSPQCFRPKTALCLCVYIFSSVHYIYYLLSFA